MLLFVALWAGALAGARTAGRWRGTRVTATQLARCFAGGALMAWGTLLIPAANDGLILVGMPLLRPYAWLAFAVMAVTIAVAHRRSPGTGAAAGAAAVRQRWRRTRRAGRRSSLSGRARRRHPRPRPRRRRAARPHHPGRSRRAGGAAGRLGWANLLARVFALDITLCRKCGGRMRVLEVVSDPDGIVRILHGARAPPRPPRPAPPGQALLFTG